MTLISKEEKIEFCEKFFNDTIKPKHLKNFESRTPGGNLIAGVICQKPNEFLGSLVITYVKTESKEFKTTQFVHAMPKIHYYSHSNELYQDSVIKTYYAYEKLDGTCLIVYPLFDDDGQVIEIVPKTRGVPVADKFILDMLKLIDTSNIYKFFEQEQDCILLFEQYGVLNQHEIFYPDSYIDIRLLGVIRNNVLVDDDITDYYADMYQFKRPEIIFECVFFKNQWSFFIETEKHPYSFYLTEEEDPIKYSTQMDLIVAIKDKLTQLNKDFVKKNNRLLTEGVVIYGQDVNKNPMYLKIKPWDIEEKCRTEYGISRKFIMKEVNKYFDEYGSQVKEIYQQNSYHYLNYVKERLSEEFSEPVVDNPKTIKRIEKCFLDMLEVKTPPVGLQQICDDLINKYPDYATKDLMRVFAQEYPEKKKYNSMAYQIIDRKKR